MDEIRCSLCISQICRTVTELMGFDAPGHAERYAGMLRLNVYGSDAREARHNELHKTRA